MSTLTPAAVEVAAGEAAEVAEVAPAVEVVEEASPVPLVGAVGAARALPVVTSPARRAGAIRGHPAAMLPAPRVATPRVHRVEVEMLPGLPAGRRLGPPNRPPAVGVFHPRRRSVPRAEITVRSRVAALRSCRQAIAPAPPTAPHNSRPVPAVRIGQPPEPPTVLPRSPAPAPALRTAPGGADRPTAGTADRPSTKPGTGAGVADRPGTKPGSGQRPTAGTRPSTSDVGNFLGVAGGAAAGSAIGGAMANRPSALPGAGERPARAEQPVRPEQRANWEERSQGRNDQWQQRVDTRNDAWNQRSESRTQARSDFQQNQDQRWNNLDTAREDRQSWRDQNREDWQGHREELWDYRGDRADEIWDNTRDFYDDVFDDRWWGNCGWGAGWVGNYPSNPWWWWRPAAWGAAAAFVSVATPDPVYIDYGMTVVYEGETVYVDNQPVPAAQYTQPMIDLAVNVEQPPPPLPAAPAAAAGAPAAAPPAEEWMPLGVFALAQEQKGDPIMFFQLSVSRAGVISGAYNSTLTADQRPVAGQVDKASQQVAWRIGDNAETIFVTSLANLTQDVSPLAIHFGTSRTQTWLLIRMPEPAAAGQPQKLPEAPKAPPPLPKKAK